MPAKEQVALRGLSGFLTLEQIWIILPPGEKEIFSLEVCVPFQRLNTDSSQMTSISEPDPELWLSQCFCFLGPNKSESLLAQIAPFPGLPVSLSLSTTSSLKSHCKESCKAVGLFLVSHISSIATSSCYGFLSWQQVWQHVQSISAC